MVRTARHPTFNYVILGAVNDSRQYVYYGIMVACMAEIGMMLLGMI